MDETYLKVKGMWSYLYRAVIQYGHTDAFLLIAKSDQATSVRFLRKAIVSWRWPTKLSLDKYQANYAAVKEWKGLGYLKRPEIRTGKCLTNLIEQDHRRIKQRVRPMQMSQAFRCANFTIAGIELAHQFRKEKRKWSTKKQSRGASKNQWLELLAA